VRWALLAGSGFIHRQRAPLKVLLVEFRDRLLRFIGRGHFHEAEAA
jgi:hypothetical protein